MNEQVKKVINEFKRRIKVLYPGEIEQVLVFGSEARGQASPESDVDVLVVTSFSDWKKGDAIRDVGYSLDEDIGYRLSIQVLSSAHIEYLREHGFTFITEVERDAIAV
jgi:predicted nucleotidyltransferase